jgi:predicted phosphodiesterase
MSELLKIQVEELLRQGYGRRRIAAKLDISEWEARILINACVQNNTPPPQEKVAIKKQATNKTLVVSDTNQQKTNIKVGINSPVDEIPSKILIRPTNLKVACLSDIHYPYEDTKAEELALSFLKTYNPNIIVWNGDIFDCVSKDTKILTSDLRWVKANDIQLGQELIGFDENCQSIKTDGRANSRKLKKSIVENVELVERPTWLLTMSTGETLTSSEKHHWLGWKGRKPRGELEWISTKEIADRVNNGSPVVIHRPVKPWEDLSKTYESGYIEAAFDGEGHITFHKEANNFGHLAFSQKDNSFLSSVEEKLHKFNYSTSRQVHTNGCVALQIKGGFWEQARFVGQFRIPRFVDKWLKTAPIETMQNNDHYRAEVVKAEYLGMTTVVSIQTSSRTFIAEGFSSHNCYSISSYNKDANKKLNIQDEIDYGVSRLEHWKLALPDTRMIFIMGNHEDRLRRLISNAAPSLATLRSTKFEEVAGLSKIGFECISSHQDLFIGSLMFYHGDAVRKNGGASGRAHFEQYGCSIIMGHCHRLSITYKRNKFGVHTIIENGTLCNFDVEYARFPDWQLGFTTIDFDGDSFAAEVHPIVQNKLIAQGKVYVQ